MAEELRQNERYQAYLAEIEAIDQESGGPDKFAVKEVVLPEEHREELTDYFKECLASIDVELEELEANREALESESRPQGSNQYIKETFRRLIRRHFYTELVGNGQLDFVAAYNKLKLDPVFIASPSEFVHQFGTCMRSLGGWIGIAEESGELPPRDTIENFEFREYLK